jgi:hypothetical protein
MSFNIFFPEESIFSVINAVFNFVKTDYKNNISTPQYSVLYKIFNGHSLGTYDFYTNAVSLFTRETTDPDIITVRLFYDGTRAVLPTVYVVLPSETETANFLGGIGYPTTDNETSPSDSSTTLYQKSFTSNYQIIFCSGNNFEVLLMHALFKYLFLSFLDVMLYNGFYQISFSSNDLNLNTEISPNPIYSRGIGLQLTYDYTVPRYFQDQIISFIEINNVTVEDNQGNEFTKDVNITIP